VAGGKRPSDDAKQQPAPRDLPRRRGLLCVPGESQRGINELRQGFFDALQYGPCERQADLGEGPTGPDPRREVSELPVTRDVAGDTMSDQLLVHLWAKPASDGQFHPLICHTLDAAFVAGMLWRHGYPEGCQDRLAERMGQARERAGPVVAFVARLDDLGKASYAFHAKWLEAEWELDCQERRFDSTPAAKGGDGR